MSNVKNNERLKSFCEKYFVKILGDSKRFTKCRPVQFFTEATNKDLIATDTLAETEPMLTIDIPLSKFEALMSIEATFFNNINNIHNQRIFECWMDQQAEERYLQQKYPAVKLSFEHYSLMLNLCRENPKKIKDL